MTWWLICTWWHDDLKTWWLICTWWHDDLYVHNDMMTWWHDEMQTWWYDEMQTWWYDDFMTWWHDDMMTWWRDDLMTWWHNDYELELLAKILGLYQSTMLRKLISKNIQIFWHLPSQPMPNFCSDPKRFRHAIRRFRHAILVKPLQNGNLRP